MKQTLEELIEHCVQYLEQKSFSIKRIERYKYVCNKKLLPYMHQGSIEYYDVTVGEEYIDSQIVGEIITPYQRDIVRCIYALNEFLAKGIVSKHYYKPFTLELGGPVGIEMEKFLLHLAHLRRGKFTINLYRRYLHRLLTFLQSKQVYQLEDLKEDYVTSFLSSSSSVNQDLISAVRMFFNFIAEKGLVKIDYSGSLIYLKSRPVEKLPSVYTKAEILQIESSIQKTDAVGKRDYAMILLATRLGLRASDIAHLRFCNLDWSQNTITLIQFKTGVELKVPLLAEVGDAIIDYLKYGRKNSESDRIFLFARAPFTAMENHSVSGTIGRIILQSGVDTTGRKKGAHSMRHSLSSRFLENKVSMPVISSALGHQSINTTMTYIRIDLESLSQCALDVQPVNNLFYNQKGRIFYE